jgi:hypothetical protein
VKVWRALFLSKFGAVIAELGTTDPATFSHQTTGWIPTYKTHLVFLYFMHFFVNGKPQNF